MEKENAIASGKNDRSDNDCLHSGLFPESPECQRNIQVMKPGDGSYLESSDATIVSNTRQESVEHNIFHLSHKHFPVNNCTETVNIEIVSDGKPERLASTVQDYSENHSGIKSPIIIHPNENPLNHMNPEYVHLKNIYHQDPSYSVLSPLSTNMAIIPGNEHSGNVKKCTSSLSPVSSAPDVASDILVLESKDARSDDVEKGWWLWIFADGWADIWMWLENLLDEIFPPAHGIQEETPDSPKERCSHNLKNKS
ncbi:uncharacterized protein LOC122250907 isoform X1 [Penaeus japonicus]|uniref:uncharacterized protein LOC122250907 isoform X1 n=1 Tax=Penaeus japonicus TaxID=27405 RepID=UPI001C716EF5|nr:uncharacterized protein LOC122250907 isoform X1 [Penaeus japonicus]